ncbi:MAG TPA: 16S rRNA (cytidine(1402)-2'-O)-methyltransferase [Methylophilaceae bacterium]|nr:16S rRNA (cytidine(1402)-2'-O)-methyltransferase [Methylophilaceae bacterium]
MSHSGTLYVVATPIGNLQDITLRALEVLKAVDLIAAEDTRHTGHLLAHFGIRKKLLAVHEHNETKAAAQLVARLQAGESVALVTDAGTPGISDPGAVAVKSCHEAGIAVVPVPGPSAVITALSVAGTAAPGFVFCGFLPASAAQRKRKLEELKLQDFALVFYEAPHRVEACLHDMVDILGPDRTLVVARELTKTFETLHRGPLGQTLDWLKGDANQQRGEFVLVVEPAPPVEVPAVNEEAVRVIKLLMAEVPLKQAVKLAAEITGAKKNALYDYALQLQGSNQPENHE